MGILRKRNLIDTDIHDILCNQRRRHALNHLRRRRETVSLAELADAVAEQETGQASPPADLRQSVYNSLHQTHLPRLDAEGVIEYDPDGKEIRLTESAREVEVYMEVFTRYGVTWAEYYRLLGTVGLCVVLLATLEMGPFALVPPVVAVTFFLVLLAVSTVYQLVTRRHVTLRQLFG
ncbi:DUF7344 domain-containing protein [Salinirubrum litoreum]|uniref:DUF7344 domain-containing protein n=1 Tax=Salinirubrum litoreum TaxID=1126234 RepID=A0ABD5R8U1_9EURY|nr:hypothetical protein [Salinirubrum litoreum]